MGVCESQNNRLDGYSYKAPTLRHVQTFGKPESHAYKFDCTGKNNLVNKELNLTFIFCNFKVKYCTSHKETKDSFYIIEISIGEKIFPLIINQGPSPNIPNQDDIKNGFIEEKTYTLNDLENTYLSIKVYEFFDDITKSLNDTTIGLPDVYKQQCKYTSFFRISLLSFLFKPVKCDFPMIGTNQLSVKTRISFYTFIEHREKITITASCLNNPYITKLILQTKDGNLEANRQQNNYFSITTPPMTIDELQKADIFLETTGTTETYNYISLNGLKTQLINNIGYQIIRQEISFNDANLHNPIDINNINANYNMNAGYNYNSGQFTLGYGGSQYNTTDINFNNQISNDQAILRLENLPIIGQINDGFYFTEYGIIYSTALLNLVNSDQELHNYRKSKQISSDDFYTKLNNYYIKLSYPNYDFSILNEMLILLMRSIDTDKFMFIYPSMEALNKMVCLFLSVGLKVIEKIKITNEEYKIIVLAKLINILMRREELDNSVIYECINGFKRYDNNTVDAKILYNQFILELFNLYQLLLSNKLAPNNDMPLIELFTRLYFQNYYFRTAVLNSLYGSPYQFDTKNALIQNDLFLYDVINDERLKKCLKSDTKKAIKNFLKSENYYNNIPFDNYRLIKRIIAYMNEININQYPSDFTFYYDNLIILQIMERDINYLKMENFDRNKLNNDFYESLMLLCNSYLSISRINNSLIMATNGHNPTAVYTLLIYYKSIFDYYQAMSNNKLIMDYSVFELATQRLSDNDDSVSLPRLFWLYYCCSDMILSGNLKWFIVNIINKNFDKFAFHWSFTIRQVFFKLVIFIINTKLKNEEGQLFKKEKMATFTNNYSPNALNSMSNPYIKESYKDYKTIEKEYNDWLARKTDNEYPVFFLPPPIANNGVID